MPASKKVTIIFILNLSFSLIEFIFGTLFFSGAILADAVHDFGDAIATGISAILERKAVKKESPNFSLGYKRFSLLGALTTNLILISGSLLVMIETIPKLWHPTIVNYDGMFVLAIFAIIINGFASFIIHSNQTKNEEILSLHFLEDILGWLAIIILSLILKWKPWYILDPLLSIAIASFILSKALPKLVATANIFLDGVPDSIDYCALHHELSQLPHIVSVNQLNVWSMDGIDHRATIHCCLRESTTEKHCKKSIRLICQRYNINSVTVEIDTSLNEHQHHCSSLSGIEVN
ncbi:TPA: cation diffusion facilitator family transporter [Streptococcus pyogenes]|uniref:cation diffusion facilitator family transporter n=1 Tax=Streptococcus pyogenes TaxID=1314 RepID=UPI00109D456A|nr:cation diffusion facilitator family transporter [Streptococcus pyogenes]QCK39121.1 cation transporter [Streptococcus pyogenes]VGW84972.1 cation diffusion facilitator transporter family protein [Streptococcus pyogenes]VGZ93894.1 cation diffusion facilitator transporter family protein [Streptococcus pyogenes]VHB02798.1 cation diffusion facilitator transporter family protein [Streptococcus pyogenes]VHC62410.1 cation diffusion facilitator transporter family protein [Streptococcus pyogenes]